MSLYLPDEVCFDCNHAVYCKHCGSYEKCGIDENYDAIHGECDFKVIVTPPDNKEK